MEVSMPARLRAEAFAREWAEAWNSHDPDRIVGHYADELTFISPLVEKRFPGHGGTLRDRKTLREYVAMGLRKRPDLHFTLLGVLHSARGFVIFYLNAVGTHTAEYVELNRAGKVTLSIACYSEKLLPMEADGRAS